jgi:hypothetical protein
LVASTVSATAIGTVVSATQIPDTTVTSTATNATETATATATISASNTPTEIPAPTATIYVTSTQTPPESTVLPSPTVSSAPDISDWVLYEDTEHGFRLRYPPTFIDRAAALRGNEILNSGTFYNPAEYDLGGSTEFNGIGIHVLANPEQFSSAQAWADAHTIGVLSASEKDLQFLSYEIIHSFPVNGQESTLFTTESVWGITQHNIFIPLTNPDKVVMFYFYENLAELETIALTMATTLEDIR